MCTQGIEKIKKRKRNEKKNAVQKEIHTHIYINTERKRGDE